MAMDAGSSSSQENQSSPSYHHQSSSPKPQSLEDLAKPWAEYAAQQALLYQRAIDHSLESAIEVSKSRLSQIRSTSFPHFQKAVVISPSLIITFVFFFSPVVLCLVFN